MGVWLDDGGGVDGCGRVWTGVDGGVDGGWRMEGSETGRGGERGGCWERDWVWKGVDGGVVDGRRRGARLGGAVGKGVWMEDGRGKRGDSGVDRVRVRSMFQG